MKKLIIAVAIVCAAAISHAAMGSWSTGYTYFNGEGSALADESGVYDFSGNAYLFILTEAQYGAINNGDAATIWGGFTANGDSSTLKIGDNTINVKSAVGLVEGEGIFVNSDDYNVGNVYAAVIVTHETDGKVDFYSANTMYGESTALQLDGVGGAALGWGAGATESPATTWNAAAVPEPTSGLLLLLGVAGLALKRKRA